MHYLGAVTDPDTGELISDAHGSEVEYTAFTETRYKITGLLIVRRVLHAGTQLGCRIGDIERAALVASLSLIGRLAARTQDMPVELEHAPGLLRALTRVPAPRDPRGVVPPLSSLLPIAVAAVSASGPRTRRTRR